MPEEVERLSVGVEADLSSLISGLESAMRAAEQAAAVIDGLLSRAATAAKLTAEALAQALQQVQQGAQGAASASSEEAAAHQAVAQAAQSAAAAERQAAEEKMRLQQEAQKAAAATAALGGALTAMAAVGTKTITSLGGIASSLNVTRNSFTRMVESAGGNAETLLQSLKAASGGMMSEQEIMSNAARAMTLIGKDAVPNLAKMMEIAKASATAMGGEVSTMFSSIALGIGRTSPMIIDNLGIMLKLGAANEQAAKSMGKTVEQLTDAEKKTAFMSAVMTAGEQTIQKMGGASMGLAGTIQGAKAAMDSLKASIGQAFIPVVQQAYQIVTFIANALNNMSDSTKQLIGKMILAGTAIAGVVGPLMLLKGGATMLPKLLSVLGPMLGPLQGMAQGLLGLKSSADQAAGALGPLSMVFKGLSAFLSANLIPIIIAVGVAVLAWQTNFLGFRDVVQGIFGFLLRSFENLMAAVAPAVSLLSTMGPKLSEVLQPLKDVFKFIDVSEIKALADELGKAGISFEGFGTLLIRVVQALPGFVEMVSGIAATIISIVGAPIKLISDFLGLLGKLEAAKKETTPSVEKAGITQRETGGLRGEIAAMRPTDEDADKVVKNVERITVAMKGGEKSARDLKGELGGTAESMQKLDGPLAQVSSGFNKMVSGFNDVDLASATMKAGLLSAGSGARQTGTEFMEMERETRQAAETMTFADRATLAYAQDVQATGAIINSMKTQFVDAYQAMADASKKWAADTLAAQQQYENQVAAANAAYNKQVFQANRAYQKQVDGENRSFQRSMVEAEAQYNQSRAAAVAQGNEQVASARKQHAAAMEAMLREHNTRLNDLEKQKETAGSFTQLAAIDEAIANENTEYEEKKSVREKEFEEELTAMQDQTAKRLAEMDREYGEAKSKRIRDHDERLAEMSAEHQERLGEMAASHSDQMGQMAAQQAERMAALKKQQEEEAAAQKKHLGELLLTLVTNLQAQGVIGPEKAKDMQEKIAEEYGLLKTEGENAFDALSWALIEMGLTEDEETANSITRWKKFADEHTDLSTSVKEAIEHISGAINTMPTEKHIKIVVDVEDPGGYLEQQSPETWLQVALENIDAAYGNLQGEMSRQPLTVDVKDLPSLKSMLNLLSSVGEAMGAVGALGAPGGQAAGGGKLQGVLDWVGGLFDAIKNSSLWTFGAAAGAGADDAEKQTNKALARVEAILSLFRSLGDAVTQITQQMAALSKLSLKGGVDVSPVFAFLQGVMDSVKDMQAFKGGEGWGDTEEAQNKLLARVEAFVKLLGTLGELVNVFAMFPELMKRLAKYKAPEGVDQTILSIVGSIQSMLEAFRVATNDFQVLIPEAASAWAGALSGLMDTLAQAMEVIPKVKSYKPLSNARDLFAGIASDLVVLGREIASAAGKMGPISDETVIWAERMKSFLELVGGAAGILPTLKKYERLSMDKEIGGTVASWSKQIEAVTKDLQALGASMSDALKGLGEVDPLADEWVARLGAFIELVVKGVEVVGKVRGYRRLSIDRMVGDRIVAWAQEFDGIVADLNALGRAVADGADAVRELPQPVIDWATSVRFLVELISSSVEAVQAARGYRRMSVTKEIGGKVVAWADEFGALVEDLNALARAVIDGSAALGTIPEAVALWVANLKQFVELVSQAVVGLDAVRDYEQITQETMIPLWGVSDVFRAIVTDLQTLRFYIEMAALSFDPIAQASLDWAAGIKSFMDIIAPAVEGFDSLREYRQISEDTEVEFVGTSDIFDAIVTDLNALAKTINAAAGNLGEITPLAVLWGQKVGGFVAVLSASLDTLGKARYYRGGLSNRFDDIIADLKSLATKMGENAGIVDEKATRWADGVKKFVDMVGSAVSSLSELRGYKALPTGVASALVSDLKFLADEIGGKAGDVTKLATDWASAAKGFVELASAAGEMSKLRNYRAVGNAAFGLIAADLKALADAIVAVSSDVEPMIGEWGKTVKDLVSLASDAATILPKLAGYKGIAKAAAAFKGIAADLNALAQAMMDASGDLGEVTPAAQEWARAMKPLLDVLEQALKVIPGARGYERLSKTVKGRSRFVSWATEFDAIGRDLEALARAIVAAGKRVGPILPETEEFVQSVKGFLDLLKLAVEVMPMAESYQKLSRWQKGVGNWSKSFAGIGDDLEALARAIRRAANRTGAIEQSTLDFADAAKKFIDLFSSALDIIIKVREAGKLDLAEKAFSQIGDTIYLLMLSIMDVKKKFQDAEDLALLKSIEEFSGQIKAALEAIGLAVDITVKLRGNVGRMTIPETVFENLKTNIINLVEAMEEVAEEFTLTAVGRDLLAKAGTIAEVLGPIGSALSSILTPMLDIQKIRWIPPKVLEDLKTNIKSIVNFMAGLATEFFGGTDLGDMKAVEAKVAPIKLFWEAMAPALDSFFSAVSGLREMKDFWQVIKQADVDRIEAGIVLVKDKIIKMAGTLATDADLAAIQRTQDVLDNINNTVTIAMDIFDKFKAATVPGEGAIGGFTGALYDIYTGLTSTLTDMGIALENFLLGYSWYDKGYDLGQSFLSGLMAAMGGGQAAGLGPGGIEGGGPPLGGEVAVLGGMGLGELPTLEVGGGQMDVIAAAVTDIAQRYAAFDLQSLAKVVDAGFNRLGTQFNVEYHGHPMEAAGLDAILNRLTFAAKLEGVL